MHIVTVTMNDAGIAEQMAGLLTTGFKAVAPDAWTTLEDARNAVRSVIEGGFARAALDQSGGVLGWVGGLPQYHGKVWELHPLVVAATNRERGIGRALVLDLEEQVRARGGLTVLLGADDQTNLTTLSDVDLYDDLPAKLATARGSHPHALEFYRKLGYAIIGVVPDANGRGKPDIILGKRVAEVLSR
jgi:aminoglycoside 6'-N-acetyltransferase I